MIAPLRKWLGASLALLMLGATMLALGSQPAAMMLFGQSPGQWTPARLNSELIAWWSPDDHGTGLMTDDGAGLISSWTGRILRRAVTATTTARPTWSATAINGFPGLVFNGTANTLVTTTLTGIPTGATPGEIWMVVKQDALVADTSTRAAFQMGAGGAQLARSLDRTGVAAVNLFRVSVASPVNDSSTIVFYGIHVISGNFTATAMSGRVDGSALAATTTIALNTSTARLRIGASNTTTATLFWNGAIGDVLITGTMTLLQRQQMEAWLHWKYGQEALLPVNHPYKSRRP